MEWSKPEEFRTEAGTLFSFDPMKCGPDILLNEEALVASYAGDDTWSTLLGNAYTFFVLALKVLKHMLTSLYRK